MGCSDAWAVDLTPEEIMEQNRVEMRQRSILERLDKVSLADLTVADLKQLIYKFGHRPFGFGMAARDYDDLDKMLSRVANKKGRKR